jgi:hypothetical protein
MPPELPGVSIWAPATLAVASQSKLPNNVLMNISLEWALKIGVKEPFDRSSFQDQSIKGCHCN